MKKTVLITGATGNIGRKLRAHLEAAGAYDLRLIDTRAEPDVVSADLSRFDAGWAALFEGVDTAVHLAADPDPHAGWASLQANNLDALFNIMAAAQQQGVRRVVFASSNHVMGGYRFSDASLTEAAEPKPGNDYGAAKLMGERLGKMFFERYGLSFIAFRIGALPPGENHRPGKSFNASPWGLQMWLSDRDLCGAFTAAIDNETVGFGVYNLVSSNKDMRWDLTALERDLGFVPQDGTDRQAGLAWRVKDALAYLRYRGIPALARKAARRHW